MAEKVKNKKIIFGKSYQNCNTKDSNAIADNNIARAISAKLHPISASRLAKAVQEYDRELAIILLQNEGISYTWAINLLPLLENQLGGDES